MTLFLVAVFYESLILKDIQVASIAPIVIDKEGLGISSATIGESMVVNLAETLVKPKMPDLSNGGKMLLFA